MFIFQLLQVLNLKTYPHLYTQVKSSQVNFMSNIRIYIHKKVQFSITEINIEIKTIATAVIKNEYFFKVFSNVRG